MEESYGNVHKERLWWVGGGMVVVVLVWYGMVPDHKGCRHKKRRLHVFFYLHVHIQFREQYGTVIILW